MGKINKFLWFVELNLGVMITAAVLIVLFIVFGTASAYEGEVGGHGHSHALGPVPIIINIIVLIVNVIILTLAFIGIQKEMRNLLVPALIWFVIYPIFHLAIVVYNFAMYHWMTSVSSLLISVIVVYFWFALVSVYDKMSPKIKLSLPEVKL